MDFQWDGWQWVTSVRLPEGTIPLCFAPEAREEGPLLPEEVALVEWTAARLPDLLDAVLPAAFAHYRSLPADEFEPGELPVADEPADLRPFIRLRSVNVHQIAWAGAPYVGFEFEADWDEEHGLGVLLHGTRAVAAGGADTAVLLWMAEEDRERQERG